MAWNDTQTSSDEISYTEWNDMVDYIESVISADSRITISDSSTNDTITIDKNSNSGESIRVDYDGSGVNHVVDIFHRDGTARTGTNAVLNVGENDSDSSADVARVANAGTGSCLEIDQNGNGIALNIDSESTTEPAIYVDQALSNGQTSFEIKHGGNTRFAGYRIDALNSAGALYIPGGFLWIDSTGDLRIKTSTPSSDTDGTVVGSQS